jgi:hypothetical protein
MKLLKSLKGFIITGQGNALGSWNSSPVQALKGRNKILAP